MEAIVSVVVEQLGAMIGNEVDLLTGVGKEVEKLHGKFTTIQAVLVKAEKKQFMDRAVRDWLRKIKVVVYEVEDILDEWRTYAFLSQREKDGIGNKRKVGPSSFFSHLWLKQVKSRHETGQTIRGITERLDEISKEKINFSFNEDIKIEEVELMPNMNARETGPFIDESKFFGRDGEKEIIINKLVSDTNQEQKSVPIISVVGMGGLGKTTLAQLVYNDQRVQTHFKKTNWVCVSDPFNVNKIAAEIIESMGGSYPKTLNLSTLQKSLREVASKEQFLLVLDDVWNEKAELWEKLRVPLKGAAQGSRILVTTRSSKVAEVMETTYMHDLAILSDLDCWNLFEFKAFKGAEDEMSQAMIKIGEEIVGRCKGIPLAVEAVGSLLGCRRTYDYWRDILESRIWEWDTDILPALLLSYYSLPLALKRCFSFCSLVPKDYELNKDELVKLWMAHDLIEYKKADFEEISREVDIEETGKRYFDYLLARSLFQDAKKDADGNIINCKMHDLVHDLATYVSDGDYRYKENLHSSISCHHLSLSTRDLLSSIPSPLCEAKRLRTLLLLGRSATVAVPDSLFDHLRFLRALDLSDTSIENLPSSIGQLKHLRYLNLSFSMIKELPESVTDLCNLQTLKLNDCDRLCMLPSGMSKMVKLRHLENEDTDSLTFLPNGLGNLSSLRTLCIFPVGDGNRGCKIGELKELNLLRGELRIENLARVIDVNEAKEAELNEKSYLHTLYFDYGDKTDEEWRKLGDDEMKSMESVFEGLRPPHSNLKKLTIEWYPGSKFSSWLADSAFSCLTELILMDCRKCRLLPGLGNLPSLKYLGIYRAGEVKVVGDEFYGNGDGQGRVFPKLEKLYFEEMTNWEEWKITDEYGEVMPSLRELEITNCNKLKALPDRLPSNLRHLKIENEEFTWTPSNALQFLEYLSLRGNVRVIEPRFPALQKSEIFAASYDTFPSDGWELLESLHTIEISQCPSLEFLPDGMGKLKALQILCISRCDQLIHLPEGLGQLQTLHTLDINLCKAFTSFTSLFNGLGQFKALRHLKIGYCAGLRSLSDGLVHFDGLQSLSVWHCYKLQSLFDGLENLKSLRSIKILDCPELRHFPPLQHLTALDELRIGLCPPDLKERLEKEIEENRCNVSHIRIQIE